MTGRVERSAEWVYQGVWRVLADCFRVPQDPPLMPVDSTEFCRSFHPSRGYLAYLKLYFWIALVVIDLVILAAWLVLLIASPLIAVVVSLPVFLVAVVPDIVAYVALHLRYDTMWYVMTDRSLRVRRGIWVIYEHTITFENVQNVDVRCGPIQQLFGIASVVVETAGSTEGDTENPFAVGNKAIMEGIDNPAEIRDLIMERVRATRSAGLGDDGTMATATRWSLREVALLREIRDEVRSLT